MKVDKEFLELVLAKTKNLELLWNYDSYAASANFESFRIQMSYATNDLYIQFLTEEMEEAEMHDGLSTIEMTKTLQKKLTDAIRIQQETRGKNKISRALQALKNPAKDAAQEDSEHFTIPIREESSENMDDDVRPYQSMPPPPSASPARMRNSLSRKASRPRLG